MGNYIHGQYEYPSITTVAGLIGKPHLIKWAADMSTDYILEHLKEILEEDNVHARKELIDKARVAHDDYRKYTARIGTEAHRAIESYIKSETKDVAECSQEVQGVFNSFLDWCDSYKPVWVASEKEVWSEKLGVAGVLDALLVVNDELWLMDFKTSKAIHAKDYALQLSGYSLCYKEMGEPFGPIKKYAILHLDWRENLVNLVDVTKKIPVSERSYRLLADFYYSFAKRRLNNPRVQEFYP